MHRRARRRAFIAFFWASRAVTQTKFGTTDHHPPSERKMQLSPEQHGDMKFECFQEPAESVKRSIQVSRGTCASRSTTWKDVQASQVMECWDYINNLFGTHKQQPRHRLNHRERQLWPRLPRAHPAHLHRNKALRSIFGMMFHCPKHEADDALVPHNTAVVVQDQVREDPAAPLLHLNVPNKLLHRSMHQLHAAQGHDLPAVLNIVRQIRQEKIHPGDS